MSTVMTANEAKADQGGRMPPKLSSDEVLAYEGLRAAMQLASDTAKAAGWYRNPETGETVQRNFGEVVGLMHSELSEALEADRKSLMDDKLSHRNGVEVEFSDCFIRVGDTAVARGDDVPGAFIEVARLLQRFSITEVRFALLLFRMLEQSDAMGLDFAGATIEKNRFNQVRADHKLEARAVAGGKKY
jgi:hypothetical protein